MEFCLLYVVYTWAELERYYLQTFISEVDNVDKSVRMVMGAFIIKERYDLSDEETV